MPLHVTAESREDSTQEHYKSSSLFLGGNKLLGKWTPHFVSYVGLVHFQGQGCARSEIHNLKRGVRCIFKARADSGLRFLSLTPRSSALDVHEPVKSISLLVLQI